jgi:formylglycine-generating enzyme required for sulfatase activity
MDLLVDQRLLSTDVAKITGEKTVEPAHEALLRQWGLLQGWLKEDTALLGVMDGVKRASRDWAANAKSATWLTHTTDRLRAAERLLERQDLAANLEPTDRNYLKACRDNELAGQRKAHRLRASFAFLTLLLAAACVAWLERDVLDHYYRWHIAMGASVLAADEEKKLAAQPNAEFAECKRGCPQMVVVPAGKFMMGTAGPMPASCGDFNLCEEPQHEVTIMNPFAISKTEVTFAQWYKCVDAGACREPEVPRESREKAPFCYPPHARDDRPVIQVSWQDAVDYTKWLSNLTGQEYRLPSEAQWEYAARAGSPASYSFGDDETKLDQYAWFNDNSGNETHPVGKKKPNAFGLYDMHGNVLEWVEDHVFNTYEGAPADGSTWLNPGLWHRRIVRGGSWKDPPDKLRSASRDGGTADGRGYCHVGFRVGRTLKP